jgi:acetyl-CoA acetyltransferase
MFFNLACVRACHPSSTLLERLPSHLACGRVSFCLSQFANGAGQRSLYPMGITEIPIHNVHNACATGSNALYLARQAVMSGLYDCTLASCKPALLRSLL